MLENIVFTAIQPNHPKVTATAPRGQLIKHPDGVDEVMMDGGVRVETEPDHRYPPFKLTTPRLTALPDENIVRSTDGVVMESPTGLLTAKSFLLNTLTRHIAFEAVDLRYAAPRSKP
jgi:LPS export ABC transporter protein LptC